MRRGHLIVFAVAFAGGFSMSATAMPDGVRIPIVDPQPERVPEAAALFRHGRHAQFNCYACHPTLFPRRRAGFTHADMEGGRLCAACHDGDGAFAVADAECGRCHVP